MKIGKYEFDLRRRAYIMGILNVTPDSFSDGGKYTGLDAALRQTEKMIHEGAAVIDIGGESTRPGYTMISPEEETERTACVIEAVKRRFDVPVSLDTYKSKVAEAGIEAGADMINDIKGFRYDEKMPVLVAKSHVACCLMHNRDEAVYTDLMEEIEADLRLSVKIAKDAGVDDDRIILDPGIGFGKTYEHNLLALRKGDRLKALGYPLLLGTSRKSVIGKTLDVPPDERVAGTVATTVLGYERGFRMFRVHDVRENLEALKMAEAVLCAAK